MTLSELLVELKAVDPDTADDIGDIVNVISIMSNGSFSSDAYYPDFIIQGCIQRACERRGWEIDQNYRTRGRDGDLPKNMRYYAVVTSWYNDVHTYRGMGGTSASALLAAYVAAVKEEKQVQCIHEQSAH